MVSVDAPHPQGLGSTGSDGECVRVCKLGTVSMCGSCGPVHIYDWRHPTLPTVTSVIPPCSLAQRRTVTSKLPATTDIEICESLTPSSVVRAVFSAVTSSSAYVAASTEVSTVRENETS